MFVWKLFWIIMLWVFWGLIVKCVSNMSSMYIMRVLIMLMVMREKFVVWEKLDWFIDKNNKVGRVILKINFELDLIKVLFS